MTEEEAKKKWCPFVRISRGLGSAWNRPSFPGDPTCIGAECMGWQWQLEYNEEKRTLEKIGGYCSLTGARND